MLVAKGIKISLEKITLCQRFGHTVETSSPDFDQWGYGAPRRIPSIENLRLVI